MKPDYVIVRLSSLGDVILTTGVLYYFYTHYGFKFIVITKKRFASVFDHHPGIIEVIALEDHELKDKQLLINWRKLAKTYQHIPLIDLHGTLRTYLLDLFWKNTVSIYNKMGLQRRIFRLSKGRLFNKKLKSLTVPQRYAQAFGQANIKAQALGPQLFLTQTELDYAREKLSTFSTRPIAIHPYATHEAKTWPVDYWLDFIHLLRKNKQEYFIIGQGEALTGLDNDFTNACTLRQSAALLSQASFLVSGDSGPMHLASGVGTPVVALFGPTGPQWGFYPQGGNDIVMELNLNCRPCTLHGKINCNRNYECMLNLKPEAVYQRLHTLGCL